MPVSTRNAKTCRQPHILRSSGQNPTAKTHIGHLVFQQMADVGACFEALLAQPTIRQRLAQAGKLDDIAPVIAARLAVLAALHDIGKVNTGFQTRIWQEADFPTDTRHPRHAGHIVDLTPVLNCDDTETADWFFNALGYRAGHHHPNEVPPYTRG